MNIIIMVPSDTYQNIVKVSKQENYMYHKFYVSYLLNKTRIKRSWSLFILILCVEVRHVDVEWLQTDVWEQELLM